MDENYPRVCRMSLIGPYSYTHAMRMGHGGRDASWVERLCRRPPLEGLGICSEGRDWSLEAGGGGGKRDEGGAEQNNEDTGGGGGG